MLTRILIKRVSTKSRRLTYPFRIEFMKYEVIEVSYPFFIQDLTDEVSYPVFFSTKSVDTRQNVVQRIQTLKN